MFWLTFMVKSMQVFQKRTDNNLDFLEELPEKEAVYSPDFLMMLLSMFNLHQFKSLGVKFSVCFFCMIM